MGLTLTTLQLIVSTMLARKQTQCDVAFVDLDAFGEVLPVLPTGKAILDIILLSNPDLRTGSITTFERRVIANNLIAPERIRYVALCIHMGGAIPMLSTA